MRYAQAAQQINYPTDAAYQAAYLEFLSGRGEIPVPIIANMEGAAIVSRPAFVAEVAMAAGGIGTRSSPKRCRSKIYDLISRSCKTYLHRSTSASIPNLRAGLGDIDDTLFAYYCYLLIADRNREIYWTNKEGTSDIPHYWYREFDLDLGASQGNISFGEAIWSREFENATVIVNPGVNQLNTPGRIQSAFMMLRGIHYYLPLRSMGAQPCFW